MSDSPDYIFELLGNETDLSTRRNAFAFLMECKQPLAIEFLEVNCDDVRFFNYFSLIFYFYFYFYTFYSTFPILFI